MDMTIVVAQPRYSVQEVKDGFQIVDSLGRDKPYLIHRVNSDEVDISSASKACAEQWAYVWNIVEMGYCGSCGKLRSEVYDGKSYVAVGFHSLDKLVCFHCACSQED